MQATRQNGHAPRGQQGRPTVPAKDVRGPERVRQILDEKRLEIEAMFARDADPKAAFTRAVGLAVDTFKQVQEGSSNPIDENSAAKAALWAFQRKLDPGLEVYFVPFKGKVTPIVSPQGLINLAHRSGFVLDCDARAVFQKEVEEGYFDHQLGSEKWVKHKKGANARPKSKQEAWQALAYTYAIINLKGGGQKIEVHDRGDIEYYRSLSKAQGGLWVDWPAEAARKAVLKQALAQVPKQTEVSEILAADAAAERSLEEGRDFWEAVEKRVQAAGGEMPPDEAPRPVVRYEAGDPAQVRAPGQNGVRVADMDGAMLTQWEGRLRADLDAGVFDPGGKRAEHAEWYIMFLMTVRQRMRDVGLAYPTHPRLGPGYTPSNRDSGAPPEEEEALAGMGASAYEAAG